MQQIFNLEIEEDYSRQFKSKTRPEKAFKIPISKIEDFQTSISNFSTRNETERRVENKEKKRVTFNPLITVVNIESLKKETYESINGEPLQNENEKKCFLCSIF